MHFREWLQDLNPPAIVRSIDQMSMADELQSLQKAVKQAEQYLLSALQLFNFQEAHWGVSQEAEEYIIPDPRFRRYMESKFKAQPIRASFGGYAKSCGQDSCAYFFTNKIVVKFLGGNRNHQEFEIANSVKGLLKLVPILDTIELEVSQTESMALIVVMRALETDFYRVGRAIQQAANIVSSTCYQLQHLVERKPDIPVEYIRKRLSFRYMMRGEGNIDPEVESAAQDLIKVVRTIYKRSGYIVGADWGGARNMGVTRSRRPQPFDFGRPDRHQAAYSQIQQADPGKEMTI